MKLRKELIIIFLLILITSYPHQRIFPSDETNLEHMSDFRVFIHMERFTFYSDEVVELKMHIRNNSYRKMIIHIYDELYTTFQPVVYDMNGREAENIVPYKLMNKNRDEILKSKEPRIISLSPNETFIHSINLKEIYKIETEREYRVKGFFSPDANNPNALSGENMLTFKVIEPVKSPQRSGIKRIKHGISPSEIIFLFLNSEKEKNWENHLKYIKISSYINSFSDFVKRYNNADDTEKLKIEEEFIRFLSSERKDYILDFKILDENIVRDRNIAYVDARVRRFEVRIPSIYQYKYTLEKFRDFWLITEVEATVMKGGLK